MPCVSEGIRHFLVSLGHGRALEFYLIAAKLLIGLNIIFSLGRPTSPVFSDLWWLSDYWLGGPFIAVAIIQLTGIVMNINGMQSSWIWRCVGASIGMSLWSWLIFKSAALGVVSAGAPTFFPFWLMSFLGSVFLFWKGVNKLPAPGAPGAA